jgi:tetratricopeptide (TPR) repeat protein
MSMTPPADAATATDIARVADRDLPKATQLARLAKSNGVRAAVVHHLVALDLKEDARFEEAIVELGLGLELEPSNARLMTTTGFCLLELDRRSEAARVFEIAIKLDPRSPDAAYGYGWAAERLGALDSARSAFDRALVLNPDHADALAGLAGLAVRRRDFSGARAWAERSVALDARQTDALTHLARIDLGVGDFDAAERRLTDLIALPHLKPVARANARILLGDALDGAGRYEAGMEAYRQGKQALGDIHAGEFARPGVAPATVVISEMRAEFEETPRKSWAPPHRLPTSKDQRGHAFLLGFPRSGTTLMEQVLATHPDIEAAGERPLLKDAEAELIRGSGDMKRLATMMSDLLEPYRKSYWRNVSEFGFAVKDKVFVDKHPLATFQLPLIHKLFPAAKIIFAIRDPRDVVLSCFRRTFNMNPSTYEFRALENTARLYEAVMRAGEVYMDRLPLNLHRLRYEALVADFEGTARSVCDFLDVDWTDQLRDFARTERTIATPSSVQVARGLYEEGVDQWRRYQFALEPVMPILQPWVDKFGYAPE